jgi:hypothetical protein
MSEVGKQQCMHILCHSIREESMSQTRASVPTFSESGSARTYRSRQWDSSGGMRFPMRRLCEKEKIRVQIRPDYLRPGEEDRMTQA